MIQGRGAERLVLIIRKIFETKVKFPNMPLKGISLSARNVNKNPNGA